MPGIGVAIATFIGFVGTTAVVVGAAIEIALAVGLSLGSNLLFGGRRETKPGSVGTQLRLVAGANIPRSFVVGRGPTHGSLTYANSHTNIDIAGNIFLTRVIAVSDIPVNGVHEIYVDGQKVTYDPDLTSVPFPPYADMGAPIPEFRAIIEGYGEFDHLWIKFYDGKQIAADPYLVARFGTHPEFPYGSDMVGTGVSYIVVTARYNSGVFTGVPDVRMVLDGVSLYDPRKDSTVGGTGAHRWDNPATWEFTQNPVVILYNVLRGIHYNDEWFYGLQNVNFRRFPLSVWFAAMNECDGIVDKKDGTEVRYQAGGEIPVNVQIKTAVEALLAACNGKLNEIGGTYKPNVGPVGSAVMSFTDSDILVNHPQIFSPVKGLESTVNHVSATYRDAIQGWVDHDAPDLINLDYEAQDGGRRLTTALALDFVSSGSQVQRIMSAALHEARKARTHTLTMQPIFYRLEPGDVVSYTSPRNGYINKLFHVVMVEVLPNLDVVITILEVDPSDYDWNPDVDERPITRVPIKPMKPGPLAVPNFNASYQKVVGDTGKGRASIRCTWDTIISKDVVGIRFQYRRAAAPTTSLENDRSEDTDTGEYNITKAIRDKTEYQVRARLRTRNGRRETVWSDWKTVTTGNSDINEDNEPPGPPTSLGVIPGRDMIVAKWINPTDSDLSHVVVLYNTTNNLGTAIAGGTIIAPAESLIISDLSEDTDYWVWAYAVDFAGNSSSVAGPIATKTEKWPFGPPNTDPPGVVTAPSITPGFLGALLEWTNPGDDDLAEIEIWVNTVNNLGSATKRAAARAPSRSGFVGGLNNNTTYWFWLRCVDYWGNAGSFVAAGSATTLAGTAHIANNAISSAMLQDLSVLTTKIANGALTSVKISDDAITTPKLAAGAVVADKIAVNAILASHIVITDLTNIVKNPFISDGNGDLSLDGWQLTGGADTLSNNATFPVRHVFRKIGDGISGFFLNPEYITVKPGEEFAVSFEWRKQPAADANLVLQLLNYDKDRVLLTPSTTTVASITPSDPSNTNVTVRVIATVDSNPSIAFIRLRWFTQATLTAGTYWWWRPIIRRASNGEMIVDGSIIAEKIAAGAVIAGKIGANAVTATEIAAGTITSSRLYAGGVQADRIQALNIAADIITATHIAGSTITAAQIAANTITSNQMAAGSILARHIRIANFINMIGNNLFEDPNTGLIDTDGWALNGNANIQNITGSGSATRFGIVLTGGSGGNNAATYLYRSAAQLNDTFTLSVSVRRGGGADANLRCDMLEYDRDGNLLTTRVFNITTSQPNNTWVHDVTGSWTVQDPACAWVGFRFITFAAHTTGTWHIARPFVRKASDASLIVDGAIVAGKIAAGAIHASSLFVDGVVITQVIANNAISISESAFTAGFVAVPHTAGVSWTNVQSLTLSGVANPGGTGFATLMYSLDFTHGVATPDALSYYIRIQIVRGGSSVVYDYEKYYLVPPHNAPVAPGTKTTQVNFARDTGVPASGNPTYTLRITQSNATSVNLRVSNRFLFGINQKK